MTTITRGTTKIWLLQPTAQEYPIRSTTDTTPIVLETILATPFTDNDWVKVKGHFNNTGVFANNGNFQIDKISPYLMTLLTSAGNGAGVSGTVAQCLDGTGCSVQAVIKQYSSGSVIASYPAVTDTVPIIFTWIDQLNFVFTLTLNDTDTLDFEGRYVFSVETTDADGNKTLIYETDLFFVTAPTS